jgi:hypothetical protein
MTALLSRPIRPAKPEETAQPRTRVCSQYETSPIRTKQLFKTTR